MTDTSTPTRADVAADAIAPFDPGTNVLIVDEEGDSALPFCLSRPNADGGLAVVTTSVPAASVTDLAPLYLADGARLDVVDCTGGSATAEAPVVTSLTSAGRDLPSVGEAAAAAVQEAETTPVTTIYLGSISELVVRSTVQQVYKLLYVVAQQVRTRGLVAFYVWDGPLEAKTLRILGQALDRLVALNGRGNPTVHSPAEWSGEHG